MIKRFSDYNETKAYGTYERLPKGGYVMDIKNAEVGGFEKVNGKNKWVNHKSDVIRVFADIYEGEQIKFFEKEYKNQQSEDKVWHGVYYLRIPADDGSEQDGWTKRKFKTFTEALEDSNNGYHFDWDEQKFKGKLIGGLFNEREYVANSGEVRRATNWAGVTSVENIRSGNFQIPKDRLLDRGYNQPPAPAMPTTSDGFMSIPDGIDEELPFH